MRKSNYLRRIVNRFLKHTYTLTTQIPVLDGDENETFDDNGNQIFEDDEPVTGKPCLFLWEEVTSIDERGGSILRTPTLYVPYDDDIVEGDKITDLEDEDNNTLLTQAVVQTINPTAEAGGQVLKVCRLTGAITI